MNGEWSLTAGQLPGALGSLVLAACLALAVVEGVVSVRRRGPTSRRAALGLLVLRLAALIMLVAWVFEPNLRVEQRAEARRRVVVLLDESASMGLADAIGDEEPRSRWSRMQAAWRSDEATLDAWDAAGIDLEWHAFAGDTRALTATEVSELAWEPSARASNLSRALEAVAEGTGRERERPVAGVIVVSDGLVAGDAAEHEHLLALAGAGEEPVEGPAYPVTTVSAGAPRIRDLAVTSLRVGEFAFVENVAEFAADLLAHGYAGREATVRLLRDGDEVARQQVTVAADGARLPLRFEVAPDRVGQFVYEIRVDPLAGEASTANNAKPFVIKVLRDKVRVLHVAGRPDWDVRSLRTLLKRDPNVELLSYYILRDGEDVARDDETAPMSLIAFPTEEIFGSELGSFDLVIMHNFDASLHGDYLANIAEYVRSGGALVIIGGDLGLAAGEYGTESFARLLAVDARFPTGIDTTPFVPRITPAGRRHPVTSWLVAGGRGGWDGLPKLDSFNRAGLAPDGARISATSLLEHPEGAAAPLLAVAEPGKGRTMVLATGASWKLGFAPDLPLVDGARPYDLLWLGAVRWLLRDDSTERLLLETRKSNHEVGEPVELQVQTLSPSYSPEAGVEVEWELRRLDGSELAVAAATATEPAKSAGEPAAAASPEPAVPIASPLRNGRWSSDALGRASTLLEELEPGAYEALAWRTDDGDGDDAEDGGAEAGPDAGPDAGPESSGGRARERVRRVFLVGAGAGELDEVDADPGRERLRELADRSDGDFVDLATGDGLPTELPLADADAGRGELRGRRDIPLWDGWVALLLLLVAYPGEWWLRRRLGKP